MEVASISPGPRIGWALHALLEEVLDDPQKNTETYLEDRAVALLVLTDEELRALGVQGKDRREEEEEKEVQMLHAKHHVS
jgi:hypothetical protein